MRANNSVSSWGAARRDFGARGDGTMDDTAALQRGLDELNAAHPVLRALPAGWDLPYYQHA